MVKFPCTNCGACCTNIHENWAGYERFRDDGWILPNGACKNFNVTTRNCNIYDSRPDVCRVDRMQHIVGFYGSQETWFDYVELCCDDAHLREYSVVRERGVSCNHKPQSK